ncbi:MAG TPA: nucleotide sugar dehydrogenase [Polyangiales bacterium]|nr:nucleotide sugar dehydrogenase [Polyangiales bacterium]
MKVCVFGLWHLGTVTASCLASLGHDVVGLDFESDVIAGLQAGRPPLFEPGLAELVQAELRAGRLTFTSDAERALAAADVLWVTYDTPVDENDVADERFVIERIARLFPHIRSGAVVLLSSQLRAGSTGQLREAYRSAQPGREVSFAYSPENLRLGKAIQVFLEPERIVVGTDDARARELLAAMFGKLAERIVWMRTESAEVTKHALNAFLAMSVSFANEVAAVCERVGADAKEVERGLKSERRIGPGAYLGAGAAFAGGTLARDVQYLKALATEHGEPCVLLTAIKESNDLHRQWVQRGLRRRFPELAGRQVTVLGLTYKPDTDTLRRSSAVELCRWLVEQRADVRAHDPRVQPAAAAEALPGVKLAAGTAAALEGSEAVVIATPWPEYANLRRDDLRGMRTPIVFDAQGLLLAALQGSDIEYHAVGQPERKRGEQ